MESKKISFAFSKVSKKNEIISKTSKSPKQVELIDCLEGQSIKVKDVIESEKGPLVIPIQSSGKNLIDRVKEAKEKLIKSEVKEEPESALSIDELAARELIREAQHRDTVKAESKVFSLPIKEDKFIAEGGVEASLEDYESVPVSDYGLAMLRGMGWKEGMPIGKSQAKTVAPLVPELRAKGLGLGANKMVNANKPKQAVDKHGKELQIVKGASVKIIAGSHKGRYCRVEGLDDENCTVIVKTAITNEVLNLNEFLMVPVTDQEYSLGSRIINNVKYEEYKTKSSDEKPRRSRSRSRSRGRQRGRKSTNEHSQHESSSCGSDYDKFIGHRSRDKAKTKGHKSNHYKEEKKRNHKSKRRD